MKPARTSPALLAIVGEGFFSRLSFGLLSFALPLYAYSLGLTLTAIGLLASLNMIVAVVLKPFAGAAADRFGLKRSLIAAIGLRSVVSLLLAFATVPWQLFATRSIHGVSIAIRDPALHVLIADQGGKKAIASSFAWYQTAKSFAGALGKIVAGALLTLTASNFKVVFGLAFVLSVVPIVLVAFWVREGGPQPVGGDLPASAHQQDEEPADGHLESAEPAGRPPLLRFAGLGFFISGTAYMLATLFPILAVEYAGLSEAGAGLIYSLSAIAVLTGPVFGWLSDNVSRKLVLSLRSGANVLSSVAYLVAPNFAGMAGGRVLDDMGKAAFRPAWGALMAEVSAFDKRKRARTMGYLSSGEDMGEIAGPIVATFIWSMWGVPVLLGARIALAVVTELYTVALTGSLRKLEADARPAPPPCANGRPADEPPGEPGPRQEGGASSRIGTTVGGYRLKALLGREGLSAVYLAQHLHLGRDVALKLLPAAFRADETLRERFERESRWASEIDHPNIVPIYDAGEAEGQHYIAMRHVQGCDLKTLIDRDGPLGLDRTLSILEQTADALDAAHDRDLVHRNVKPANILIEERSERVFVSNFGVAKHAGSHGLTGTGFFVGTVDYAAPEQIEGLSVDARTDVYSLGCTLYACLTGRAPFERKREVAVMYAHLTEPPPKLSHARPDLPKDLNRVIATAMAKASKDRYGSCGQLIAAARSAARRPPATAEAWHSGLERGAPSLGRVVRSRRDARSRPALQL